MPLVVIGAGIYGIQAEIHDRAAVRQVAGWAAAEGRVVAVSDNGRTFAPVVQFRAASGESVRFQAPFSETEPRVGDPARVSYDPSDPQQAHDLSGDQSSWKFPFFTSIFLVTLGTLAEIGYSLAILRRRGGTRARPRQVNTVR